jgi:hypothetical protein
VVVHVARSATGKRHVTEVIEVVEGGGEPAGRELLGTTAWADQLTRLRAPVATR